MTTDDLEPRRRAIRKLVRLSGEPYPEARATQLIRQMEQAAKNEQREDAKRARRKEGK